MLYLITAQRGVLRRNRLLIGVAAVVLVAGIVGYVSATAGARRGHQAGQTTSRTVGGRVRAAARLTAVSPALGLRPGAFSPIAQGYSAAQAALPNLTPLQLAGQRVIYSYTGVNPPSGLISLIKNGEAAGVIFFGGNVGSTPPTAAQLAHFKVVVAKLQAAAASPSNPVHQPLLLMTDQEGGVVRRLPGAPVLSAKQIGRSAHPQAAATKAGAGAASNLRGFGLNVNLAPVLDVFRKPGNFIDQFGRSFSSNPAKVATLGTLYAKAEIAGHIGATVKHFPGLGAATRTQNTDLRPVTLKLPLASIRSVDELPYKSAIAAKVQLVMVSWAIYPALGATRPGGLSVKVVRGELRQRLGFAGVTITDAIGAGALKPFGATGNRVTMASRAGMDLMLCAAQNFREGDTAIHALATFFSAGSPATKAAFKAAVERVIALRATLPGTLGTLPS